MRKGRPRTEDELIEAVRSSDVRAPDTLHNTVQALIASRTRAHGWRLALRRCEPLARGVTVRRWGLAMAVVGLTATLALLVALVAGSRGGAFTVREAGAVIVAGKRPPALDGAVARRDRTAFHLIELAGAEAVAWLRAGHLCVVSGRGLDGSTLLGLASWSGGGSRS